MSKLHQYLRAASQADCNELNELIEQAMNSIDEILKQFPGEEANWVGKLCAAFDTIESIHAVTQEFVEEEELPDCDDEYPDCDDDEYIPSAFSAIAKILNPPDPEYVQAPEEVLSIYPTVFLLDEISQEFVGES